MSQGRRFFPKLPWFLIVVALAVIGGVLLAAHSEIAQAQTVKSITNDDSTYYRLKVKLTYKGDPQDFDITVGCNVRQIFYKEGGSTYEAGLIPTVFGRRMSDGKALVVRPPNACRGETTANGKVQPDLLPMVIVYDSADRLDFGVAYLSEDAYENPLSVLKFGGATIEKATRSEFDEFRRTQTNVLTRELYHSTTGRYRELKLAQVDGRFAYACVAYARFRIPEAARSAVDTYWPNTHPRYWRPDTYEADSKLGEAILSRKQGDRSQTDRPDDPPYPTRAFLPLSDEPVDLGLPTRARGGLVSVQRGAAPRSYYPAANDYRMDRWPRNRSDWPDYIAGRSDFADVDIDFRDGQSRGFGYCFASRAGAPDPELLKLEQSKRIVGRVDGQAITSKRGPLGPSTMPARIFERDEYVFVFVRIYLGSSGGDV